MRRRQFLQATPLGITLIAGCNTQAEPDDIPQTTSSNNSGIPFQFGVEVSEAKPSRQSPPIILVKIKNTDNTDHILTISNNDFPFGSPGSNKKDGHSLLLSSDVPHQKEGDCWRGDWKSEPMISGMKFGPEDSTSEKYAILNPREQTRCWPIGTFEFRDTYYLDPPDTNSKASENKFEWGFGIKISENKTISVSNILSPTDIHSQ